MANDNSLALVGAAVNQAQELSKQIQVLSGNMVTDDDSLILASMFMAGHFKDMKSLYSAVVRASFGKRIGIDAMTAVTSLYIVDGKPALEAQAIRNTCVMAGYDIVTKELTSERCVLEWFYKGKKLGESEFTKIDAMRMGFIDPTCLKWPDEHNTREVRFWNKWKKPVAGWDNKKGCECKDNWIKTPKPMLLARATTYGNRLYGNHAFSQEVYDIEELRDSNIREDTTAIDAFKARIENAKTMDELQEITKDLAPDELGTLIEDINVKAREFLDESDNSRSTAKK